MEPIIHVAIHQNQSNQMKSTMNCRKTSAFSTAPCSSTILASSALSRVRGMFPTYSLLAATSDVATGASAVTAETAMGRLGFMALNVTELRKWKGFSGWIEGFEWRVRVLVGWWRRVCEKSEEIAAIVGEKLRVLEKRWGWHCSFCSGGLRRWLGFITLSELGWGLAVSHRHVTPPNPRYIFIIIINIFLNLTLIGYQNL